jgi:hypothetical protein
MSPNHRKLPSHMFLAVFGPPRTAEGRLLDCFSDGFSPLLSHSQPLSSSRVSLRFSDSRASKSQDTFDGDFLNFSVAPFDLPLEVSTFIMSFLPIKSLAQFGAVCKWSRHLISHMSYDNSALSSFLKWGAFDLLSPMGLISRIAADTKIHSPQSHLSWEKRKYTSGPAKQETTVMKFRSHQAPNNDDAHVVSLLIHSASSQKSIQLDSLQDFFDSVSLQDSYDSARLLDSIRPASLQQSLTSDADLFSDADFFPFTIPDFTSLKTLGLFRKRLSMQAFYSLQTRQLESLFLFDCSLESDVFGEAMQNGNQASQTSVLLFFVKRLYFDVRLSTALTNVTLYSGLVELKVHLSSASATQQFNVYAQRCISLERM